VAEYAYRMVKDFTRDPLAAGPHAVFAGGRAGVLAAIEAQDGAWVKC
jgi:hypothetical protein